MDIAILGCGPTGLFAAQAATRHGHDVRIYSKPRKSRTNGAQYLHQPIPGLSEQRFEITYDLVGDASGYRAKVYGADSPVAVSVESLVGKAPAWDVRAAYDHAWDQYGADVREWDGHEHAMPKADVVISTIPRGTLCWQPEVHNFAYEEVWATDKVMYSDALPPALDNFVLCSGKPVDRWYRQSRIQGYENTEWPIEVFRNENSLRMDGHKLWRVVKPLETDCDCYVGEDVFFVGRYGEWRKGVLAHSGYYDTAQILTDLAAAR